MIIAWMIFATVVGLLFTGAALAAEGFAKALKLPTRPVWGVALLLTVLWPIVASLRAVMTEPVPETLHRSVTIHPMSETPSMLTTFQTAAARMLSGELGRVLGWSFLAIWGLVSLALVGRLLWSMWQLHRWQHAWRRTEVDGVTVRLSNNVGPAVIGVGTLEVVLPEWVLALDAPLRALILRHEQEHRSAGDPFLLLLTTLVVALVPWNVALWWQLQRLRLAIEVDCDDRVLSTHPQQERYGLLLLALAQRKTNTPTQCVTALVESPSHLERRIIAMRNRTLPISRFRVLAGSVVAVSAVALACGVEAPTRPSPATQTAAPDKNVAQTVPITSVGALLESRVPGLTVIRSDSGKSSRTRLRLPRANESKEWAVNIDPIVIVDSIRVMMDTGRLSGTIAPLDQIDPNMIETIEVLKGPNAVSRYGSDAANGVIVVKTKKGAQK